MFSHSLLDVNFHKYLFYGANVVFWTLGWGKLVIGIWLYTQNGLYSILAPTSYSAMSSAGLSISIGAMVLIISFIGCVGNWLRSKCLLISFFSFVSLLLLVQCMTGVMGFLYRDLIRQRTKYNLHATLNQTHGDFGPAIHFRSTWNQMQANLKCCGVDNYTDWFVAPQWKGRRFVPDSCCNLAFFDIAKKNATLNCGKSEANAKLFYSQGCAEPFTDWLLQHLYIVGIVAIFFAFVETFLLVSSLRILCHIHRKERKRRAEANNCSYKYTRNGRDVHDGECTLIASTVEG